MLRLLLRLFCFPFLLAAVSVFVILHGFFLLSSSVRRRILYSIISQHIPFLRCYVLFARVISITLTFFFGAAFVRSSSRSQCFSFLFFGAMLSGARSVFVSSIYSSVLCTLRHPVLGSVLSSPRCGVILFGPRRFMFC